MQGKIILQAEFQREYVWDDTRASRFIESLLLNLPVPPVFLAENENGTWDVVDGHQRLESIFGFLQPLSEGPAGSAQVRPSFRSLRLKNLQVLHDEFGGFRASDLSLPNRQALLEQTIGVISIPKSANRDLRFVLFERLNLGSVPLNPQELRNCMFRGPFNNLIAQLATEPDTLQFFGMKEKHKRMRNRELVLKFFAFAHRLGQYRTPQRAFLNDEMENNQHCDFDEALRFKAEFSDAKKWTRAVFGNESCRLFRQGSTGNPRGRWDPRWTDLVYQVEVVAFASYADSLRDLLASGQVSRDKFLRALRHKLVGVMVGENFLRTINEGTTRQENVELRHRLWDGAMASAMDHPDVTNDMVDEVAAMLQRSNLCSACLTPIDSLDDADKSVDSGTPGAVHRHCRRVQLSRTA
jgi:hypothetical protein